MLRERKNIRLKGWDYRAEGCYFLTICCKDRKSFFGTIEDNKMHLSTIGKIVSQFWMEIPNHFQHVKIDEFVIMPNHIHGIIFVGSRHGVTLPVQNTNQFSKPLKDSVSVIINQFKSSVKRCCNKNGFRNFGWQSRFYDHIVHDDSSIRNKRAYIKNNPSNWVKDNLNV